MTSDNTRSRRLLPLAGGMLPCFKAVRWASGPCPVNGIHR